MYQSVEGIALRGDMVKLLQYTQKMRTNLRNTLEPELDLYDTAFMSYSLQ